MMNHARPANPSVPWRTLGLALAVLTLPAVIAVIVILLSSGSTTSDGGHRATVGPGVAVAGGSAACAKTSRDPVNSTRSGAANQVVPPGATAVLLCRYGPRGKRVLERGVTAVATVSRLAGELNSLPAGTGVYSCPIDTGESIVADFAYPNGPENPVSVGLSGCGAVSNGHAHRIAARTQVVGRLEALIPWLGTIRGRVVMCGGPAPGRCRAASGSGSCGRSECVHGEQVAIMHPLGEPYPTVRVRHGRFTARVEPGRYRLALLSGGRAGVQVRVLGTAHVRVRFNRTTRVAFRIQVR